MRGLRLLSRAGCNRAREEQFHGMDRILGMQSVRPGLRTVRQRLRVGRLGRLHRHGRTRRPYGGGVHDEPDARTRGRHRGLEIVMAAYDGLKGLRGRRTQASVPSSCYSRMAACRAFIRVLAWTTPRRSGATLDSNDRHSPDHRRVRGCHSYRSPDSAGRAAHAGAGRRSRCSAWTLEIPISSVRSNCSASHGGLVVPGHPHEWVTERGGEWCTCLAPPVAATRVSMLNKLGEGVEWKAR